MTKARIDQTIARARRGSDPRAEAGSTASKSMPRMAT